MIGCAWTTASEKDLFKMLSKALCINCIVDTNHKDCPFLTITGRDLNGKTFNIARALFPNEMA